VVSRTRPCFKGGTKAPFLPFAKRGRGRSRGGGRRRFFMFGGAAPRRAALLKSPPSEGQRGATAVAERRAGHRFPNYKPLQRLTALSPARRVILSPFHPLSCSAGASMVLLNWSGHFYKWMSLHVKQFIPGSCPAAPSPASLLATLRRNLERDRQR